MGLFVEQRGSVFLVAVMCLLFVGICAPFSGHDLQRVMQIGIGACAVGIYIKIVGRSYGLRDSAPRGSQSAPS